MPWRPRCPDRLIQSHRREPDGSATIEFTGYVHQVESAGDKLNVKVRGPAGLLADMPLPFQPPGLALATDPTGFVHWWRMMVYVFPDLPDPHRAPRLRPPLADEEVVIAKRFCVVADGLARSALIQDPGAVTLTPLPDGDQVVGTFPPLDAQVGFAGLLRQCDDPNEPASFSKVKNGLARAATRASNQAVGDALEKWAATVKALGRRSLDHALCDALVDREGWRAFAIGEQPSPKQLLATFNYGELIHWGDRRDAVLPDAAGLMAARQRYDFLGAALGLAHSYIGFATFVRGVASLDS